MGLHLNLIGRSGTVFKVLRKLPVTSNTLEQNFGCNKEHYRVKLKLAEVIGGSIGTIQSDPERSQKNANTSEGRLTSTRRSDAPGLT